jgi:hypothetical protein
MKVGKQVKEEEMKSEGSGRDERRKRNNIFKKRYEKTEK